MRTLNEIFYISGSKSNVFLLGELSVLGQPKINKNLGEKISTN